MAGAGATVVHVGLVGIALFVGAHFARQVAKAPAVTQLVEVEFPPEVAPPRDAPSRAPIDRSIPHRAKPTPAAAPPAAAQAGQVLTAADEVVDFGDQFVEGKGLGYVGGVTEANGSSTHAVRDLGARGGGASVAAAPPAVDHSRAAQLAGGLAWDCPFPTEADDAGVDHAVVTLRIEVAADGHVSKVTATRDPGHGFAREARRYALSKRWSAALDHAGQPINSTTVVNVRFDR